MSLEFLYHWNHIAHPAHRLFLVVGVLKEKEIKMIVQNNPAPWVILATVVMGGCLITGMMLGGVGPFNSETTEAKLQITQTQAAMNAHATQSVLELAQTQQAPLAQQTAIVAQMTVVPLQQTATQAAELGVVENAQLFATQTAIVGETINRQLAIHATQTAIARNQEKEALSVGATATAMAQDQAREKAGGTISIVSVGIGVLMLCGWILARVITQAAHARAQEKMAQARFLAEQRRMLSLRASLQNHNGHKPSHPIPNSLLKDVGEVNKLPKTK